MIFAPSIWSNTHLGVVVVVVVSCLRRARNLNLGLTRTLTLILFEMPPLNYSLILLSNSLEGFFSN